MEELELNNKWMVCVRCVTYNQSRYITDAMNGFAMQQTDFPFVCCIVDDASTDGEQEVIKDYLKDFFDLQDVSVAYEKDEEYGHVTYARHKTNENCFFAVLYLKENHRRQKKPKYPYLTEWNDNAKYIAICDGDDYWTDPVKLQKQMDFLETHPDYSLCCHRFKIFYENTNTWTDDWGGRAFAVKPNSANGIEVTNSENFKTRFTQTLTLCYRKAAEDKIVWPPYKFGHRDFNSHYHLLKLGKGWCFEDYMGVYRKHDGGVWSRLSPMEGAMTRLVAYEDLYKFNRSDNDILMCYSEWLSRFYRRFVMPPFQRHKLTRNGIKSLWFYFKHCWKVRSPFVAVKKFVKCFCVFLGFIKG